MLFRWYGSLIVKGLCASWALGYRWHSLHLWHWHRCIPACWPRRRWLVSNLLVKLVVGHWVATGHCFANVCDVMESVPPRENFKHTQDIQRMILPHLNLGWSNKHLVEILEVESGVPSYKQDIAARSRRHNSSYENGSVRPCVNWVIFRLGFDFWIVISFFIRHSLGPSLNCQFSPSSPKSDFDSAAIFKLDSLF